MPYSLDTSAILDGWVRYYPPDIFAGVWNRLEEAIRDGLLRVTEEVASELSKKDDGAYDWVVAQENFIVPLDEQVQSVVAMILETHPNLVDIRKNKSMCDPFVIA